MKIAVISDIHGDIKKLKFFIDYITKEGIETVLNLGDIIGGDNPVEVLRIIMNDKRFINIKGNHDSSLFLEDELSTKEIDWLKNLPLTRVFKFESKKFLMVHSRISSNTEVPLLYNEKSLLEFLKDYKGDYDYVLFGHTHFQCLLSYYEGKTMINPGSLGLSYDEKISFCIIDLENNNIAINMQKISI